jgi:hypothetical protein
VGNKSITFNKPQDTVVFEVRRRTTKVTISMADLGTFVGKATCNKSDKFSEAVGQNIALHRAMKKLSEAGEKYWISRATSVEDWRKHHPHKSLPALPK